MPSTLRCELDKLGYDWDSGQIIHQPGSGWQTPKPSRLIENDDPLLDQQWSNGSGFIDVPRVMAADSLAVYIPYQDIRSSGIRRIFHEPAEYVDRGEQLPYPEN